jgi:hypothetical protein
MANTDAPPELSSNTLAKHPVELIIQAARSGTVLDEATWTSYRKTKPEVQEWIDAIQSSDDVNSVLRFAIFELFKKRIEGQLSRDDIRADELPESLPVVNLRTMTGGE